MKKERMSFHPEEAIDCGRIEREEKQKMKYLEQCVQREGPERVSMEIERLQPKDINALIQQQDGDPSVTMALLMSPIVNCRFETIAALLFHSADPLAPVKTFLNHRHGEVETRTALEQCVMHAHNDPAPFVFLLRLMDLRKPERPLQKTPCFNIPPGVSEPVVQPNAFDYLGRYVNAPLTATNFDDNWYRASMTALMYACEHSLPLCVKWLLEKRKADPTVRFIMSDGRSTMDALGIALDKLEESGGAPECLHIVKLLRDHKKVKIVHLSPYAARLARYSL